MRLLGRAFSIVLVYPESINVSFLSLKIISTIYLINICYVPIMCRVQGKGWQTMVQRTCSYVVCEPRMVFTFFLNGWKKTKEK